MLTVLEVCFHMNLVHSPFLNKCVSIIVEGNQRTQIFADTGEGTLYTSDGSGVIFDESLRKHLYPNGYIDLTDFYKVCARHRRICLFAKISQKGNEQ